MQGCLSPSLRISEDVRRTTEKPGTILLIADFIFRRISLLDGSLKATESGELSHVRVCDLHVRQIGWADLRTFFHRQFSSECSLMDCDGE
jgi:hypothetical protein